jgi:membrane protein
MRNISARHRSHSTLSDAGAGAVGRGVPVTGVSGVARGGSGIGGLYGRTTVERYHVLVPETPLSVETLATRFVRGVRLAGRAVVRGFIEFYQSSNLTYASSIAFYSLSSLFPFVLLVLALLSRLTLADENERVLALMARAMPRQFEFVSTQIHAMAGASLELGVTFTVLLMWSSMGVFAAITSAVNHAWGVEKPVGFFKHKLIAFSMLIIAGVLMIAALMLVSAVEVVQTRWFAGFVTNAPWLWRLTSWAARNAPLAMFIGVVGLIYYYLPNTRVRLRDVWFGAVLAGLLWRGAFAAFTWFVRDLSRFSVHGSVAAVVAFMLWVYVSAVILLYGVEVTAAYAKLRRTEPTMQS